MSLQQELRSWLAPEPSKTTVASSTPQIGSPAPHTASLSLPLNHDIDHPDQNHTTPDHARESSASTRASSRRSLILFSRHCGCPFAEKAFLNFRQTAQRHRDLDFVFVSQSDRATTTSWLASLPQAGSEPRHLIVRADPHLDLYAAWGLGASSYAHVLSPVSLYRVVRLGLDEGIWNRPTVSGSRWQTAGAFGVDAKGVVRWGGTASRADDVPDFEEGVSALANVDAER